MSYEGHPFCDAHGWQETEVMHKKVKSTTAGCVCAYHKEKRRGRSHSLRRHARVDVGLSEG